MKNVSHLSLTDIGSAIRGSKSKLAACAIAGVVLVGSDMYLSCRSEVTVWRRLVVIIVGLAIYIVAGGGNTKALGLQWFPRHGFGYWCKVTIAMLAIVGGLCLLVGGIAYVGGWNVTIAVFPFEPSVVRALLYSMCVEAPIAEESIYRMLLCVPAVPILGPRATVLLGGIVFALLHVAYGNPSPENAIGGFLLTWAFLESESLIIPIALHSLGNLCVALSKGFLFVDIA